MRKHIWATFLMAVDSAAGLVFGLQVAVILAVVLGTVCVYMYRDEILSVFPESYGVAGSHAYRGHLVLGSIVVFGVFVAAATLYWDRVSSTPPSLTTDKSFVEGVMGRPLTTIEREMRRVKPTNLEISALRAARSLLSMLENARGDHTRYAMEARLLTSWNLSPAGGYERTPRTDQSFQIDPSRNGAIYVFSDEFVEMVDGPRWQNYLSFMLPHLEKFGMERALHETSRYNRQ